MKSTLLCALSLLLVATRGEAQDRIVSQPKPVRLNAKSLGLSSLVATSPSSQTMNTSVSFARRVDASGRPLWSMVATDQGASGELIDIFAQVDRQPRYLADDTWTRALTGVMYASQLTLIERDVFEPPSLGPDLDPRQRLLNFFLVWTAGHIVDTGHMKDQLPPGFQFVILTRQQGGSFLFRFNTSILE